MTNAELQTICAALGIETKWINGEMAISAEGAVKLAKHAPDQERATAFLAQLKAQGFTS